MKGKEKQGERQKLGAEKRNWNFQGPKRLVYIYRRELEPGLNI